MKKLKKILLINWLYFSKEVIEVGDVNFLTGKNGAGKSTVIDALQIVLLGETNARNFNLAANERSQRTLDGYLRADMDENNPYSRRGKDFSTYIVCEFEDDVEHNSFVCGVMFDCRSDGSKHDHFFIYVGKLPENCFIEDGEAMDIHDLRKFLKQNFSRAEVYDTQWEYRRNMLSRWNVHNEQVLRMMKKAVSFRPIVDIQQFITENICDIPDKPDIEAMQQNIRNYKRHEQLAQQQEEKLTALQEISTLYREMTRSVDRWRVQSFLVQWAQKEDMQAQIDSREQEKRNCLSELTAADTAIEDLAGQVQAKEERRRQMDRDYAQSDTYQERERLGNQKLVEIYPKEPCQTQCIFEIGQFHTVLPIINALHAYQSKAFLNFRFAETTFFSQFPDFLSCCFGVYRHTNMFIHPEHPPAILFQRPADIKYSTVPPKNFLGQDKIFLFSFLLLKGGFLSTFLSF